MTSFDPFLFNPDRRGGRYQGLADRAGTGRQYASAVKLMCLQCVGFDYEAARECEAGHCALWACSRSLFGAQDSGVPEPDLAPISSSPSPSVPPGEKEARK